MTATEWATGLLSGHWTPWIVAALCIEVTYLLWVYTYWMRKGVRQVRPVPFIGNLWEPIIFRRTFGQVLQDVYKNPNFEKQPFVGIYKVMQPVLIVKEPELIKEVLVQNFTSFQHTELVFEPGTDEVFSENPFFAGSDRWKELRTRVSQAFSPARVRQAFGDVAACGENLIQYVSAIAKENKSVNAFELGQRFTTNTAVRVLFGLESHSLEAGSPPGVFYDAGYQIFNSSSVLDRLRLMAFAIYPKALNILGHELVAKDSIAFFRKLIQDSVEFRHKEGIVHDDLVQWACKRVLQDDGTIDPKELRLMTAQAINSFVEIFETSAGSLAAVLLMMALIPEEQETLRERLRSVIPEGKPLDQETIANAEYLDWVIKETLRLWPPADVIRRTCTKATTLRSSTGASVQMSLGDLAFICVEGVHRDPAYYSHADEFWPQHFSEEEAAARPKSTYLAFGDGPRMCPGYRFAMMQLKVAVATIVLNFDVKPGPELKTPPIRDPKSFMLGFKGGVWLKFHPLK